MSDDVARDKLIALPHGVLSVFWFYNIHKLLNITARNDDFNMVAAIIDGGFNGCNDRLDIFRKSVRILKGEHINRLMLNEMFGFEDSSIAQNSICSLDWRLWHDPAFSRTGTDKSRL